MTETFSWHRSMLDAQTGHHVIGDPNCSTCCYCTKAEPCEICGGILHVELDDELDGEFYHSFRCDRLCECPYCPRFQNEENQ